jgi:hypothetical protein
MSRTLKRLSVQTEYEDFSWRQPGSLLRIVFDREAIEGGKTKKLRLLVADGDYAPSLHQAGDPAVVVANLDRFSADHGAGAKYPRYWV